MGTCSKEAGRLNRFVRLCTKPLFQAAGLGSLDEFAILAQVDYLGECTKKTAIEENLIDLTTGIDAVRRLVKKKLLKEKVNKNDRRERLIPLTPQGKKIIGQVYQGFAGIQDVLADLSEEECSQLVGLQKSLDGFHSRNLQGGA